MLKNSRVWVVPMRTVDLRYVFLLGKRGPRCNNPGQWGFFGGNVDPGETAQQAAVREFLEETGVVISEAALVPLFADNVTTRKGNVKPCTWFGIDADKLSLSPQLTKEVVDYEWVNRDLFASTDLHYSAQKFAQWMEMLGNTAENSHAMLDVAYLRSQNLL